jgi:hypothetical protein
VLVILGNTARQQTHTTDEIVNPHYAKTHDQ